MVMNIKQNKIKIEPRRKLNYNTHVKFAKIKFTSPNPKAIALNTLSPRQFNRSKRVLTADCSSGTSVGQCCNKIVPNYEKN